MYRIMITNAYASHVEIVKTRSDAKKRFQELIRDWKNINVTVFNAQNAIVAQILN